MRSPKRVSICRSRVERVPICTRISCPFAPARRAHRHRPVRQANLHPSALLQQRHASGGPLQSPYGRRLHRQRRCAKQRQQLLFVGVDRWRAWFLMPSQNVVPVNTDGKNQRT